MSTAENIINYENCVGSEFVFHGPDLGEPVNLKLVKFKAGSMGAGFGSASMLFEGPAESFLPQGNYEVKHETSEPTVWFTTPVGKGNAGFQYEVIFTWLIPAADEAIIQQQGDTQ